MSHPAPGCDAIIFGEHRRAGATRSWSSSASAGWAQSSSAPAAVERVRDGSELVGAAPAEVGAEGFEIPLGLWDGSSRLRRPSTAIASTRASLPSGLARGVGPSARAARHPSLPRPRRARERDLRVDRDRPSPPAGDVPRTETSSSRRSGSRPDPRDQPPGGGSTAGGSPSPLVGGGGQVKPGAVFEKRRPVQMGSTTALADAVLPPFGCF